MHPIVPKEEKKFKSKLMINPNTTHQKHKKYSPTPKICSRLQKEALQLWFLHRSRYMLYFP